MYDRHGITLRDRFRVDRRSLLARRWSNAALRRVAPLCSGSVVNVSAWHDEDKEGGRYRDYFENASEYVVTNAPGARGYTGAKDEILLDLLEPPPDELERRFDVVFNHTTLEHIFPVTRAFEHLCALSSDLVIVVVPFSQQQHETEDWKDYWRFTPSCLRALFDENGFEVVWESQTPFRRSAIYIVSVASRSPEDWSDLTRVPRRVDAAGEWIGQSFTTSIRGSLERVQSRVRR